MSCRFLVLKGCLRVDEIILRVREKLLLILLDCHRRWLQLVDHRLLLSSLRRRRLATSSSARSCQIVDFLIIPAAFVSCGLAVRLLISQLPTRHLVAATPWFLLLAWVKFLLGNNSIRILLWIFSCCLWNRAYRLDCARAWISLLKMLLLLYIRMIVKFRENWCFGLLLDLVLIWGLVLGWSFYN